MASEDSTTDADSIYAYYMFVNHGWKPSDWNNLSYREKILMSVFISEEIKSRKELEKRH